TAQRRRQSKGLAQFDALGSQQRRVAGAVGRDAESSVGRLGEAPGVNQVLIEVSGQPGDGRGQGRLDEASRVEQAAIFQCFQNEAGTLTRRTTGADRLPKTGPSAHRYSS